MKDLELFRPIFERFNNLNLLALMEDLQQDRVAFNWWRNEGRI